MFDSGFETSTSLFQQPIYKGDSGGWGRDIFQVALAQSNLTWDLSTVLSSLCYGYPFGNRTIFQEVRRAPWLSEINSDGSIAESLIPPHGRVWRTPKQIAEELLERLSEEARKVLAVREEVYLLLSGGLDSRIVGGILRHLRKTGKLDGNIIALTWGKKDSRDVYYARECANLLGFDWRHVPMDQQHLNENVNLAAVALGAAVSPVHLHRMNWFETNVSSEAIVVAGSYGDSVGRSEFSGRTVLELLPLRPFNYAGLIKSEAAAKAQLGLQSDLQDIRSRAGLQPEYVHREHERQCHYMRGLIATAMSVINRYCATYQMFTDIDVYSYMWSIHPSARTDVVYAELLDLLGKDISLIPWARTNRSIRGDKSRRVQQLSAAFHDYYHWVTEHARTECDRLGESDFYGAFERAGFFEMDKLKQFFRRMMNSDRDPNLRTTRAYTSLAWLMSMAKLDENLHRSIRTPNIKYDTGNGQTQFSQNGRTTIRAFLSGIPVLRRAASRVRRWYLRKSAMRKYPPRSE